VLLGLCGPAASTAEVRDGWAVANGLRADVVATDQGTILSWHHLVADPDAPGPPHLSNPTLSTTIAGQAASPRSAFAFAGSDHPYAIGFIAVGSGMMPSTAAKPLAVLFVAHARATNVRWLVVSGVGKVAAYQEWTEALADAVVSPGIAAAQVGPLLATAVGALMEAEALRRALMLPAAMLDPAYIESLEAAYKSGIALFPVLRPGAPAPEDFASLVANSGGRFLRWDGRIPSEAEAAAALAELLSGQIVIYEQLEGYLLPGETPPTATFTLVSARGPLELSMPAPLASASFGQYLNPAEWRRWTASDGRKKYGWGMIGAAAAAVTGGVVFLLVGVRRHEPIAILHISEGRKPVKVRKSPFVIGRGDDADLVIDDESVSREHAKLVAVPGGVALVDMGSRNGTFVESARVTRARLSPDQVVSIGGVQVRIQIPTPEPG
jgi:hypothetical protein